MPRFELNMIDRSIQVLDTARWINAALFAEEYRDIAEEMAHRLNIRHLATLTREQRKAVQHEVRCTLALCNHRCSCAGENQSHPIEYKPEPSREV
jgi:hypothetical protein